MKYEFGKEKAFEILENAYCPYSNFPVGSCVVCHDGSYYCCLLYTSPSPRDS